MRFIRTTLLAGSVFALAACAGDQESPVAVPAAPEAPVIAAGPGGQAIEGQYIVVLKEGANPRSVAAIAGVDPQIVYTAVLNGFAATLNAGQLTALQHNPGVEYIEQDQVATPEATQSNATWGIDRIDQRNRPLSGTYTYTATASNVYAYIIDSGVRASHNEFRNSDGTTRASNVYNGTGDGQNTDCNGHGTHVAGTVGGKTYGVAKEVRIRGVKVFTCSGGSAYSVIIGGMDWVTANHIKPAVANLSLGGGYSSAVNTSLNNMANAGVFPAVAAGNSNANACNYSPASAANATTVAASTSTDAKASYSNYGNCVHLYAPGSSITSAWYQSDTQTNTISGTSMATPHVAGTGALYKATNGDASYSVIRTWIINNATTGVISGNVTGTPNRLLFKSTL